LGGLKFRKQPISGYVSNHVPKIFFQSKEAKMCEFSMQHGEGKQWYLLMQNYSAELLHTRLTPEQIEITGFTNRMEWIDDDIRRTIVPAAGGKAPELLHLDDDKTEEPKIKLSDEQILAKRKIDHFGQVLPIEDVLQVLDRASSITRLPCACRYFNRGLINQRYCFGLGEGPPMIMSKYPDDTANLEVIGKEEASALIKKFDEEGLMHSVWSSVTPYVAGLCICDGDCEAYGAYIRDKGLPTFFRAEYICQVDPDQCAGCKECMRQCQFGAQFYSSAMGKVTIEPRLCFGCGVCRAACPQGAIALIPRKAVPVAAEIW
jgi:ferredoxin